jgi:hypothetical protein
MFENVYKILNRSKKLSESDAFRFAVNEDVKKLIIHLNTVIQLGEEGIDGEGNKLRSYSSWTVLIRHEMGLQTDHVDFKVTGEYWGSWKVNVVGDNIEITVDSARFDELVNELNFSGEHVGLTEENISILANRMLPRYREYVIKKILG